MLQLTVFSMVPGMLLMLFIPKITEITGVWKGMLIGGAIFAVGFLITMLAPNHAVIYAGCIVRGTGQAIISPLMITAVAQLADYNCLKNNNKPLIGITNCVVSVGNKIGTGLAGAIIGWGLAYAGYDGAATVQTTHTVFFEKMLYCQIPLMAAIFLLVFTSGLNVEKALKELKH